MFCGGSLIANKGFRLGNTRVANWFGGSKFAIEKMLGKMYGRSRASFICFIGKSVLTHITERARTSSSSDGSIFRIRRPSENLSKTVVKPFMNETFSSRVFAVKFERSRKFSVDIGRDEKKGCDGSVDGVGRLFPCRVIKSRKRATQSPNYSSA